MKQFIWKELRVNFKWAALGFVILYGMLYLEYFSQTIFLESGRTLEMFSFLSALMGFLFGLVQAYPESAPDRWAFSMHRPLSAKQIALSKIIVGISLLTSIWVLAITLGVIQFVVYDKLNYPMYWFRPIPVFIVTLVGIHAYLIGLIILVWKPRWRITRLLFLAPGGIITFAQPIYMTDLGWNYLWVTLLADLIFFALLLVTVFNMFETTGEQARTSHLPRLVTLCSVTVGMLLLISFGIAFLSEFVVTRQRTMKSTYLAVETNGAIYRVVSLYDYRKRKSLILDVENIDVPDDKPFQKEIAEKQLTSNDFYHSKKLATRITTQRTRAYRSHGLYRYEGSGQFNLDGTSGTFTVSKHEGLIYLYRPAIKRNRYVMSSIIGKNGNATPYDEKPESFGKIVKIDQQSITESYLRKDGHLTSLYVDAEKCLIICADAIYKFGLSAKTVEKIYTPPTQSPILNVGYFEDEKSPLFVIEHPDSIRIFSAKKEVVGNFKNPEKLTTKPAYLYIPDEEVGLIPLTEIYKKFSPDKSRVFPTLSYLPQKKALMLRGQTIAQQQMVQVNFAGEVIDDRTFNHADTHLGTIDYQLPLSEQLSFLIAPPVAGVGVIIFLIFGVGTEGLVLLTKAHLPILAFCVVSFIATILIGQWYCRRNCMSKQQRRLCFWASLLFGPAGVIAFWMIEEPAHLEPCESCDKKMSVRDDVCPACGTSRKPLPEQTKEIIAEELSLTKIDQTSAHTPPEAVTS